MRARQSRGEAAPTPCQQVRLNLRGRRCSREGLPTEPMLLVRAAHIAVAIRMKVSIRTARWKGAAARVPARSRRRRIARTTECPRERPATPSASSSGEDIEALLGQTRARVCLGTPPALPPAQDVHAPFGTGATTRRRALRPLLVEPRTNGFAVAPTRSAKHIRSLEPERRGPRLPEFGARSVQCHPEAGTGLTRWRSRRLRTEVGCQAAYSSRLRIAPARSSIGQARVRYSGCQP